MTIQSSSYKGGLMLIISIYMEKSWQNVFIHDPFYYIFQIYICIWLHNANIIMLSVAQMTHVAHGPLVILPLITVLRNQQACSRKFPKI